MEAKLKKALGNYICEPQMLKEYQILEKIIMHFIIKIQLNLAYLVFQSAEFSSNLTDKYWKTLKNVFYYLKKTKNFNLFYI